MPDDRLLDIATLRERCACSRSTAYQLAHHLGAVHIGGALRVSEARLRQYIETGGSKSLTAQAEAMNGAHKARAKRLKRATTTAEKQGAVR